MVKRSFIIIAALVLAAATAGCSAGPQEYVTIPAPMATQANETAAPVEPAPAPTPTRPRRKRVQKKGGGKFSRRLQRLSLRYM